MPLPSLYGVAQAAAIRLKTLVPRMRGKKLVLAWVVDLAHNEKQKAKRSHEVLQDFL